MEEDADFGNIQAASPEHGVVAKGGLRAPPFSYKKRGETVPDVKGRQQLSAGSWLPCGNLDPNCQIFRSSRKAENLEIRVKFLKF